MRVVGSRNRQLNVGEEAMIQVACLDDEMRQEVVRVPNKKNLVLSTRILRQSDFSKELGSRHA